MPMTLPIAKLVAQAGQRLEALNQTLEAVEARSTMAACPLTPAPAVTPDQLTARADALAARLLAGAESALELADRLHAAPQIRAQEVGLATRLAGTAAQLMHAVARRQGISSVQTVRVERVVVEEGGQAIVGAIGRGRP
jgi:hypothetical protein